MQANVMLGYRDKIIKAFKDGTLPSEYLKKSDAADYDYVLKNVGKFIQKIESMAEILTYVCSMIFLNHHHQLIMQKS